MKHAIRAVNPDTGEQFVFGEKYRTEGAARKTARALSLLFDDVEIGTIDDDNNFSPTKTHSAGDW